MSLPQSRYNLTQADDGSKSWISGSGRAWFFVRQIPEGNRRTYAPCVTYEAAKLLFDNHQREENG